MSNPAGIACGAGDGCTEQYALGTGVSLTATPDEGSIFVDWTGACPSGSPTTTVVVDADKTCTVRFDREPTITQTSFISRPFPIGAAALPPSNIGGGNQNTLVVVGANDAGTVELYDITNPAAPVLLPGSGNEFCPDAGSVFFAPHPSGSGVPYFIATSLLNFQKCTNTIPLAEPAIANLPFAPGQGASVPGTQDIVLSDFGGGRLRRVALTGGPFASIPLATERSCPNDLAVSGNLALVVGEEGFPGTTLDCTRQTNLFFVDLTTNQATGSVDVGTTPRRVVPSPDGQRAFVSGFGEDCIFVVNTSTKAVERTFAVGDGPFGMAFTPDGSDLLVVNRTEHRLQVLDPSTGEERLSIDTGGVNPEDVIVAPDGKTVIVINSGDRLTGAGGSISVFNLVP